MDLAQIFVLERLIMFGLSGRILSQGYDYIFEIRVQFSIVYAHVGMTYFQKKNFTSTRRTIFQFC
jgi:hypothetical protein